jgi:hypothetical protein
MGSITNSDLELAAALIQKDVAAHAFDIGKRTITNGSDNTLTVSWAYQGSTSTMSPPAYLLRLQAMHQRYHRYTVSDFYIPGTVNAMADNTSRLLHLAPAQLLTHFNTRYPQVLPWRFVTPRPEMISSVTSDLRRTRPDVGSFCQLPPATIAPGERSMPGVPYYYYRRYHIIIMRVIGIRDQIK